MEEDFWVWWKKIEADKDSLNLRMAFDAGYLAASKTISQRIEMHIDADYESRAFTLAADIAIGVK